jgi:hypothetical protein
MEASQASSKQLCITAHTTELLMPNVQGTVRQKLEQVAKVTVLKDTQRTAALLLTLKHTINEHTRREDIHADNKDNKAGLALGHSTSLGAPQASLQSHSLRTTSHTWCWRIQSASATHQKGLPNSHDTTAGLNKQHERWQTAIGTISAPPQPDVCDLLYNHNQALM